jgi:hypothetical protein
MNLGNGRCDHDSPRMKRLALGRFGDVGMSHRLSVAFESPHAGWLPLHLRVDDTEISLEVSYTPNDFLEELIGAVASVVSTQGSFRALAYEEPDRALVVLTRHKDVIVLSVRRDLESEPIFTFSGTVASVVLPIWRGLRRLQADPDIGEWGLRFPTERMIQLTEAVDRLKSSAA